MSDIRFRAWDRKERKMIDEALLFGNIGLGDGSVVIDEEAQKGNELDWMQFTSLKDKNGKEIYEGDIVEIHCHYSYKDKNKFNVIGVGMVCFGDFDNGKFYEDCERGLGFYLKINYNDEGYDYVQDIKLGDKNDKYEVIGNIYKNPELKKR